MPAPCRIPDVRAGHVPLSSPSHRLHASRRGPRSSRASGAPGPPRRARRRRCPRSAAPDRAASSSCRLSRMAHRQAKSSRRPRARRSSVLLASASREVMVTRSGSAATGTTRTRTPLAACLSPRVPGRPRGSGAQWVKMRTNKRGGVADQRMKGDQHTGNDDDCAPEPSAVLGRVRAMGRSIGSRPNRSVPGNRRRPIADASQQRPFWFAPDERKAGAMSGLRFERRKRGGSAEAGGRAGGGPEEIPAGAWVKGRTVSPARRGWKAGGMAACPAARAGGDGSKRA